MRAITFELPIRIRSEMNVRQHYMGRASHFKKHRRDVALAFRAAVGPPPHEMPLPAAVTITRLAPTFIHDDDNLVSGCKAIRDQVAECCGWNDRDKRIAWVYGQEKARQYGVRVTIQPENRRESA